MRKRSNRLTSPYNAYSRIAANREDAYLTHVDRGTPCGEYLRRFWHPIELASEVREFPVAVRILGEDLVLFRDLGGSLGLLERACCHRSTSLEFGRIRERGIQCPYHGWHFDVDGTILDAPTEAADSKIKSRMFQGAYLVREHMGLIFAYMGPPEKEPEFPIFDHYLRPAKRCVCNKEPSPCNWLQVRENEMDPMHIVFLHTLIAGVQFSNVFGEIPELHFVETPFWSFGRRHPPPQGLPSTPEPTTWCCRTYRGSRPSMMPRVKPSVTSAPDSLGGWFRSTIPIPCPSAGANSKRSFRIRSVTP